MTVILLIWGFKNSEKIISSFVSTTAQLYQKRYGGMALFKMQPIVATVAAGFNYYIAYLPHSKNHFYISSIGSSQVALKHDA